MRNLSRIAKGELSEAKEDFSPGYKLGARIRRNERLFVEKTKDLTGKDSVLCRTETNGPITMVEVGTGKPVAIVGTSKDRPWGVYLLKSVETGRVIEFGVPRNRYVEVSTKVVRVPDKPAQTEPETKTGPKNEVADDSSMLQTFVGPAGLSERFSALEKFPRLSEEDQKDLLLRIMIAFDEMRWEMGRMKKIFSDMKTSLAGEQGGSDQ